MLKQPFLRLIGWMQISRPRTVCYVYIKEPTICDKASGSFSQSVSWDIGGRLYLTIWTFIIGTEISFHLATLSTNILLARVDVLKCGSTGCMDEPSLTLWIVLAFWRAIPWLWTSSSSSGRCLWWQMRV